MIKHPDQHDRMIAGRIALIMNHVFFGSMAMRLKLVEDENFTYPWNNEPCLGGVDGKNLIYNPLALAKLNRAEVVGFIAHEVMHIMLCHHVRRGDRDPKGWNIAADIAGNLQLVDLFEEAAKNRGNGSWFKLPEGGLIEKQFAGMSAEEVYMRLSQQANEDGADGQGQGKKGFDVLSDGKNAAGQQLSESEARAEIARVKAELQNAANLARKAGHMTAGLEKFIDEICEPKANWRQLLADFVTEKAELDYNWAKPHQRMLHQYGIVLPTLDGEKLGHVVTIVDTSGSCWDELAQFMAELSDILSNYECDLTVVYHDTRVTKVEEFSSNDMPIQLAPAGGGGTCAREAYEWVAENTDADFIIHLTDGFLNFKVIVAPDVPVLIACSDKTGAKDCPDWATVIDIT